MARHGNQFQSYFLDLFKIEEHNVLEIDFVNLKVETSPFIKDYKKTAEKKILLLGPNDQG